MQKRQLLGIIEVNMLDIRFIREHAEEVQEKAKQKGYDVDVKRLIKLDEEIKHHMVELEKARQASNELAGQVKGGKPSDEQVEKGRKLREIITDLERRINDLRLHAEGDELIYDQLLKTIPNIFPDDTPLGGEEANRQEKTWGKAEAKDVKDHLTWAEERGLLDFERGAKVAGNKFYFEKGALVELEFAVLQLGLKLAKDAGFEPMLVPHMVKSSVIDGAGFTAKSTDEKQIYEVKDEDLNLIATAEIPLTGYHADEILADKDLPKLYAGYSPAYRLEAGAYGKHSKGLYRVHQFNKLELYVFCRPEESEQWHQKLLELEEKICQALELPYRVVRIAAGDLGAPAYKKYDVEYWSPVDKEYRELMSVSNVTDYQARRLNIRYKTAEGKNEFVHTLNGTAAAMSRIIIALVENHQGGEGQVSIPEALQSYMHGQKTI